MSRLHRRATKNLKKTLQQIRSKVLEGHSIADSMRDHPKVFFTHFYRASTSGRTHRRA